jgi:hypothetical protein
VRKLDKVRLEGFTSSKGSVMNAMRRRDKDPGRKWDYSQCRQELRHADYHCIKGAGTPEELTSCRGTFRDQPAGLIALWPETIWAPEVIPYDGSITYDPGDDKPAGSSQWRRAIDDVRNSLSARPEITVLEVGVYSGGGDAAALELAQRRAEELVGRMVTLSRVERERLVPRAYGPDHYRTGRAGTVEFTAVPSDEDLDQLMEDIQDLPDL